MLRIFPPLDGKLSVPVSQPLEPAYIDAIIRGITIVTEPIIIAIGGLSGSGKSSLARKINQGQMVHLSTDTLRNSLSPSDKRNFDSPYNLGKYAPEERARIYDELFKRTGEALQAGYPVVIDATFLDEEDRIEVEHIAKAHSVPFLGLWCEASAEILEQRVALRAAHSDDSDAGVRVLHQQLENYDPESINWIRVR